MTNTNTNNNKLSHHELMVQEARAAGVAFCHRPLNTLRCGDKLEVIYYFEDDTQDRTKGFYGGAITKLGKDSIELARVDCGGVITTRTIDLNDPNNWLQLELGGNGKGYCHLPVVDKARKDAKEAESAWLRSADRLATLCNKADKVELDDLQFCTNRANETAITHHAAKEALKTALVGVNNEEYI